MEEYDNLMKNAEHHKTLGNRRLACYFYNLAVESTEDTDKKIEALKNISRLTEGILRDDTKRLIEIYSQTDKIDEAIKESGVMSLRDIMIDVQKDK